MRAFLALMLAVRVAAALAGAVAAIMLAAAVVGVGNIGDSAESLVYLLRLGVAAAAISYAGWRVDPDRMSR